MGLSSTTASHSMPTNTFLAQQTRIVLESCFTKMDGCWSLGPRRLEVACRPLPGVELSGHHPPTLEDHMPFSIK